MSIATPKKIEPRFDHVSDDSYFIVYHLSVTVLFFWGVTITHPDTHTAQQEKWVKCPLHRPSPGCEFQAWEMLRLFSSRGDCVTLDGRGTGMAVKNYTHISIYMYTHNYVIHFYIYIWVLKKKLFLHIVALYDIIWYYIITIYIYIPTYTLW
jgi:hypothetical protein